MKSKQNIISIRWINIFGLKLIKVKEYEKYSKYYFYNLFLFKKNVSKKISQKQSEKSNFKKEITEIVRRELPRIICASNLHQKTFNKYKNINTGKTVVLIASGPTVDKYTPIKGALHVAVNRSFMFDKVEFDYLFIQDYVAMKSYEALARDYHPEHCKKFYGIIPIYPEIMIPESTAIEAGAERFYTEPLPLCNYAFDVSSQAFGDAHSIVFPAMQFILWTNPAKIYLVGCDCADTGYFSTKEKISQSFTLKIDDCTKGWKAMKRFANLYYPKTEIISINPIGLKGLFEDLYTDEEEVSYGSNGRCCC